MTILFFFVIVGVIGAFAENNEDKTDEKAYTDETLNFLDECGAKDVVLCFKERALKYVNNLPSNLPIGGGITIKSTEDNSNRSARIFNVDDLPEEPRARENEIDKILSDRIFGYLSSHSIEFKMPDAAVQEFKRSIEEGRKKKKKGMMPLLMLLKLKMAMLGAIALKVLALVAFKALVVAKIALTISLIIGLKKLTESKHHSSYEVVAHDDHHGHGRSLGQDLAYRGYKEESLAL